MNTEAEHECHLPYPIESVLKHTIDSGIFIGLRRRWYSFCMISRKHPHTSMYYASSDSCRREEIRHAVHYLYMIHPFSMLCLYWEFFIWFIYLFCYVSQASTAARLYGKASDNLKITRVLGNAVLLVDIAKQFFTGYYDTDLCRSVLRISMVAKRYIKLYFWVDMLSISYVFMIFLEFTSFDPRTVDLCVSISRLLGLLKIARIPRWSAACELFRQYYDHTSYIFSSFRLAVVYIIILSWLTSLTFYLQNILGKFYKQDMPPVEKMYLSTFLVLLVASYGERPIHQNHEVITSRLFLCVGYTIQLYLYAQILQIWTKFVHARNKNENLYQQFKEYMKYKGLPVDLRDKIHSYFRFKFQNEFFNEIEINEILSNNLREEILLHVTKCHIERVSLFNNIPENILVKVVSKLKTEIYLPEDIIVQAGSKGICMYFIYFGTVAVYTPSGKEICHLEDGAHFGEIALVFSEKRTASVVAVTACELFRLNRSDFFEVMEPFPELMEKIVGMAHERLVGTTKEYWHE